MNKIWIEIGLLVLEKILEKRNITPDHIDKIAYLAEGNPKEIINQPEVKQGVADAIFGLLDSIFSDP